MEKLFAVIVLIIGLTVGFIVGVTSAISSFDETVQRLQEECDDKRPVYQNENLELAHFSR